MQFGPDRHIEDDDLERYSMGTLLEAENPVLEEHLLVCHSCQDRLYQMDQFLETLRAVSLGLMTERESIWARLRSFVVLPWLANYPAWATAAAVLALVFLAGLTWQLRKGAADKPIALMLVAERNGAVSAPAQKPLLLELDAKGLPNLPSYRLEVVDQSGTRVLESGVRPKDNKISHLVSDKLAPGDYFVRLYAPRGDQLREFAVRLQ